jgi:hypothetical protein
VFVSQKNSPFYIWVIIQKYHFLADWASFCMFKRVAVGLSINMTAVP